MSSLKDLASLIMIPSLYKDGELHTVKPLADENIIVHPDATDNNDGVDGTTPSTSSNFTFSRGSNLAATRVDVNGLIEKGRENLLLQSNQFDTSWVNSNATLTSGQSGYDGSNDAWLLTKTASSGNIYQGKSYSGVNTFSIYAKGNTTDWIRLRNTGGYVYFDVSNGVVGGNISAISPKIISVGNGWYRCEVAWNGTGTITQVFVADSDGSTSGTSGSIYIQDAQLEQGLVATDYIETTTTSVSAGILEDMPRLDYSGSCPSLLLEPSRTNIIPFSEYYNAGSWLKLNSSITDNATTSPEGFVNASLQTENSSAGFHAIYDNITAAFNTPFTFSAFVKPNGRDIVYLRMENASTGGGLAITYFNINTGQILADSSTSSSIEEFPNGWYRLSITGTTSASTSTLFVMGLASANDTRSYTGNGISGAYFYGASAEAGSYPTSYIPTYGTSQTRSNDSCVATSVSDVIGQTEGVAFVEFDKKNGTGERRFFLQIGSGSTTIYARLESNNSLTTQILNGGTNYLTSTGTIIPSGNNKFAVAYANNDAVFYLNGTQLASSSSVVVPALSDLYIGSNSSNAQTIAGEIKQALLFKTRLTNAELAALTTL